MLYRWSSTRHTATWEQVGERYQVTGATDSTWEQFAHDGPGTYRLTLSKGTVDAAPSKKITITASSNNKPGGGKMLRDNALSEFSPALDDPGIATPSMRGYEFLLTPKVAKEFGFIIMNLEFSSNGELPQGALYKLTWREALASSEGGFRRMYLTNGDNGVQFASNIRVSHEYRFSGPADGFKAPERTLIFARNRSNKLHLRASIRFAAESAPWSSKHIEIPPGKRLLVSEIDCFIEQPVYGCTIAYDKNAKEPEPVPPTPQGDTETSKAIYSVDKDAEGGWLVTFHRTSTVRVHTTAPFVYSEMVIPAGDGVLVRKGQFVEIQLGWRRWSRLSDADYRHQDD